MAIAGASIDVAREILIGAGGDLEVALNHFFSSPQPAVQPPAPVPTKTPPPPNTPAPPKTPAPLNTPAPAKTPAPLTTTALPKTPVQAAKPPQMTTPQNANALGISESSGSAAKFKNLWDDDDDDEEDDEGLPFSFSLPHRPEERKDFQENKRELNKIDLSSEEGDEDDEMDRPKSPATLQFEADLAAALKLSVTQGLENPRGKKRPIDADDGNERNVRPRLEESPHPSTGTDYNEDRLIPATWNIRPGVDATFARFAARMGEMVDIFNQLRSGVYRYFSLAPLSQEPCLFVMCDLCILGLPQILSALQSSCASINARHKSPLLHFVDITIEIASF